MSLLSQFAMHPSGDVSLDTLKVNHVLGWHFGA
jgi:hypothetical protein